MRVMILIMMLLSAKICFGASPWYAGVGVGATNYQGDSINIDRPEDNLLLNLDGWETGFNVFGGYQFNESWAVEFGYTDFGETSDFDPDGQILGVGLDYESAGIYLNGQYHIALNNSLSLDLVGGWLFGEAKSTLALAPDTDGPKSSEDFSDNGAMLGLAFTWHATRSFGVRGTANYYLIDYDNTIKKPWRLGVDLIWNF